ncbi:MAG TPA: prepilin-type cleavage/methylation domain-containing protein [Desulfuromonadales bacterium]|nr:prepilin-type cleavage/methylation domain-containing protein [Desulfuromonadales bacterium]
MYLHPNAISNNQAGFTLIEFCVAVVIMMVGLLGLLQAVNMATVHNMGTVLRNEAMSLSDEQMVLIKTSIIDSTSFSNLASSSDYVSRKNRGGFSNYSVARTISSASTNTKEVLVRVSWRYKGNKFNHAITTLVTNPAP